MEKKKERTVMVCFNCDKYIGVGREAYQALKNHYINDHKITIEQFKKVHPDLMRKNVGVYKVKSEEPIAPPESRASRK